MPISKIILVASGKGGVGKSTITVALANALAAQGKKIGILDCDIFGPNIPTLMGAEAAPKIEEVSPGVEMFVPVKSRGIELMSMGFLVNPDDPLIWRGPKLHETIRQFTSQIAWGDLDYLLVDTPPGTGDVQISLAQMLPLFGVIIVTTPQEVALDDVKKSVMMWNEVRVPVLGVIENMSYFKCAKCDKKHFIFGSGGGQKLSKIFDVEFLGEICHFKNPLEPNDEIIAVSKRLDSIGPEPLSPLVIN